ncbi:unnamed protein product [Cuscuta europaea]|uniref:Uncharacterized protein n=1 Tax=Cuscuta europaea TaxID=41803 RepID=A0A9P0YVI2_CUSEU|nr:unnamed protein product [Cuscuta europaea]
MYNFERQKSVKEPRCSSFSSTLLDEIYRSIDGFDEKKLINRPIRRTYANDDDNNGVVSFRRACLIEKLMEQKLVNHKFSSTKPSKGAKRFSSLLLSTSYDDPFFFSSTTPRSSSAAQTADSDFSGSSWKCNSSSKKTSCFNSTRSSKTVRTTTLGLEKSRMIKPPVSPGARLTNFINCLFVSRGHTRKGRDKSALSTSPSTPTSTARSCLNKTPRMSGSKAKRTVRFNPVGVILGEDCSQEHIYGGGEFPAPGFQETKKAHHEAAAALSRGHIVLKGYHQHRNHHQWKNEESWMSAEEGRGSCDDDDDLSDSSSDLFEIDHHALFGKRRFREELPVFESTHLDSSRISATGLVR